MLSETIKSRLAERFAMPLPEFYQRRIIFWPDEDGEFAEAVDELTLDGVTLVKLTGNNNFAVKKLLAADDLTIDYIGYTARSAMVTQAVDAVAIFLNNDLRVFDQWLDKFATMADNGDHRFDASTMGCIDHPANEGFFKYLMCYFWLG